MSDALNAAEVAAFEVLSAGISGALVTQHAPEDQVLPVVIIGDMEGGRKLGGKGKSRSREIPVQIVVVTEGEERKPCSALLGQVETLLDGETISAGGFDVTFELERSASVLAETGDGYVGLAAFTAFAIAA